MRIPQFRLVLVLLASALPGGVRHSVGAVAPSNQPARRECRALPRTGLAV